ncbi:MAG: HTH-type transcriptional repressor CarH [Flavobacteriaceae bacterium]|nr:MAG: HTH-type transcriptional repressor CarH [Flavobacteriaceae bacterium]|tara:strand:+ start:1816 stop:2697 length:882 start_codon:yes stop_codon:yes gene_type:complete
MYSIKDLERFSGIKSHTIRIWEKRYNLLKPHRTDSNIRYYNDDELRRLLNLCTLISYGEKISKVSQLSDVEIYSKIDVLMLPDSKNVQLDVFINSIIESGITYNYQLLDSTFEAAILKLGFTKCYTDVILPSLVKMGLLWGKSKMIPSQGHFISNFIKLKLFSAIDGIKLPKQNSKKFLLFLPENEEHEIGLLFAYYLIRKAGHKVVYLGQNVPTDNLESSINQIKPDVLLLFIVRTWHKDELNPLIELIVGNSQNGKIILCGKASATELVKENKLLLIANSIQDLEKITQFV